MINPNDFNILVLVRCNYTASGIYGKLFLNDVFQCYTCENRFTAIKDRIAYDVRLDRKSPKFSKIYPYKSLCSGFVPFIDVPDRDGILIHIGNYPKDSSGCVLVGNKYFYNDDCIYESTAAFTTLYKKLKVLKYPIKFYVLDVHDI